MTISAPTERSINCSRCGAPTEWDESYGPAPLCVACWDDKAGKDNDRAAYKRAYNQAHREEQAAYKRAYYQAHREEQAAHQRAYNQAHREEQAAYQRAYYQAHKKQGGGTMKLLETIRGG